MQEQENQNLALETSKNKEIAQKRPTLSEAGKIANKIAFKHVFRRYLQEKSHNTLERHRRDLELFKEFLQEIGIDFDQDANLQRDPDAWQGLTWGIVEGFVNWQLTRGYAINSVNARLSTIRVYSKLAVKAGTISQDEGMLIQNVRGFSQKSGLNADDLRNTTRKNHARYTYTTSTSDKEIEVLRRSSKKASAIQITDEQAGMMVIMRNGSAQAARDALMMSLLLEHGLRASELALLRADNIDLERGLLRFTRPKVRGTEHENAVQQLTSRSLLLATTYLNRFYPSTLQPYGALILATTRLKKDGSGGELKSSGLNRSKITKRVAYIGRELAIDKLSAHDCRHYCATKMARLGYGIDELMAWFGWTNAQTAMRYVHAADILVRNKG